MKFNDEQLLRYSRHILLPEIELEGQIKLAQSKALIVGAGGLGSSAALYLGASGVGELSIADNDEVELSNLQRQIAHQESTVGINKAYSCAQSVAQINSKIKINTLASYLVDSQLEDEVNKADIVVDCSDNLDTRLAVNKQCVKSQTPLVSAAAIGWQGQLAVYPFHDKHYRAQGPCYQCFYDPNTHINQSCSQNGVVSPLVGIMGSLQALEVVKTLLGHGKEQQGKVLLFDALQQHWEPMMLPKHPDCPICSAV